MRARLSLLTVLVACVAVPTASAANPEQALAERYAPVVRLVEHTDCPPGKPYLPIDVNLLFDEPTVALRGPWGNDLVKIAPSAKDSRRSQARPAISQARNRLPSYSSC